MFEVKAMLESILVRKLRKQMNDIICYLEAISIARGESQ